jgi:AraC family transcriptional activator of pobA
MKSEQPKISKLESITEIHRMLIIPGPAHPLITLLDTREESINLSLLPVSYVTTLYKISFVTKLGGQFRYGQGYYDFDEGSMVFTAPHQIVGSTAIYKGNEG